jgi:hypothetical protein
VIGDAAGRLATAVRSSTLKRLRARLRAGACVAILLTSTAGAQSLTVTVIGSNQVSFSLTPGAVSNPGSNTITVSTVAALGPGPPVRLSLYAYFTDAMAALSYQAPCGTCPNIPSASVEISVNAGGFRPVNQSGPFSPNASLELWSLPAAPGSRSPAARNGTRAVTLTFNINLSTLPDLAAGDYAGTLVLQAQAVT